MFKKSNIQIHNEANVIEFNKLRVTDIEKMDRSIFRTEYLRNKFSMTEYVDRLKEIYESKNRIERKISDYLSIENNIKSNLELTNTKDKQYMYYSIGYFINRILGQLKIKDNYRIFNYGVFENNDIIVAYFDLTMKKYDLDFTEFTEVLCKILKTDTNNTVFNKNGEVYELILYKKNLLSVDFSTIFNLTNFEELEEEGIRFPLIVGKDESCRNKYLDLERNNSMLILGESGSGKSSMLNLLLMNMICLYSEEEISIILMDRKNDIINEYFSYAPHFIGYHHEVKNYLQILREIKKEMETRKEIVDSANVEIWQDLRDYLTREEEYDFIKAFPWIVLAIDELNVTMLEMKETGNENLKEFEDLLNYIISNGRSYGVKIIMVSQKLCLPVELVDNITIKIFFKHYDNDFNGLIDNRYIDPPSSVGEFVLDDKDNIYPVRVKSAILGLDDFEKMKYLIRTLTTDMSRGIVDEEVYRSSSFNVSNNRKDFINKVDLLNKDILFDVQKNTRVFDIAVDILKGRFESSNYK